MVCQCQYAKDGPVEYHKDWWFQLETGVYLSSILIEHWIRMWSPCHTIHKYDETNLGAWNQYGVADNLAQVKSEYKQFWEADRKFCLTLAIIRKHQAGDWRWSRWGPYIGTQNLTCEYLRDEPDIKRAVLFHFYELDSKVCNSVPAP